MAITVYYNNEEVIYSKEADFVSHMFSILISGKFEFSNILTLKENFENAFLMLNEFLVQQKEAIKEKKLNASMQYKIQLRSDMMKVSNLIRRLGTLRQYLGKVSNLLGFKTCIYNFILSLSNMSLLPGFSYGTKKGTATFGNAEIISIEEAKKVIW